MTKEHYYPMGIKTKEHYYKAHIVKTSKTYNPKDNWNTYDTENITGKTLKEVKDKLKEQYYHVKTKHKIYRDTKNGAEHVGWIYGFRGDWGGEHWLEQHWIELTEVTEKTVL